MPKLAAPRLAASAVIATLDNMVVFMEPLLQCWTCMLDLRIPNRRDAPAFREPSRKHVYRGGSGLMVRDALRPPHHNGKNQLTARRLILLSANSVSFRSVAFSSSSVFCKMLAQSLR